MMRALIQRVGLALALALLVTASGCGSLLGRANDGVVMVADDDPKMLAAIDKARATADTFIAALNAPKPTQSEFAVKLGVKDGEKVEHMWLSPVRFEGGRFHGVINNDAELVRTVKLGDTVTAEKSEISDWMYVQDGKLVGGYTIRVLRDQMGEAERKEMDQSLPFKVE
ncbi:MAG: YegJ family protein [Actinomycetota bacterium]